MKERWARRWGWALALLLGWSHPVEAGGGGGQAKLFYFQVTDVCHWTVRDLGRHQTTVLHSTPVCPKVVWGEQEAGGLAAFYLVGDAIWRKRLSDGTKPTLVARIPPDERQYSGADSDWWIDAESGRFRTARQVEVKWTLGADTITFEGKAYDAARFGASSELTPAFLEVREDQEGTWQRVALLPTNSGSCGSWGDGVLGDLPGFRDRRRVNFLSPDDNGQDRGSEEEKALSGGCPRDHFYRLGGSEILCLENDSADGPNFEPPLYRCRWPCRDAREVTLFGPESSVEITTRGPYALIRGGERAQVLQEGVDKPVFEVSFPAHDGIVDEVAERVFWLPGP